MICVRVRCSVRGGVRARRHTADASRASRQSHLTASLVYESSEGGEESAYDDRMSLDTCARRVVRRMNMLAEHPITAASSALRRLQSLHWLMIVLLFFLQKQNLVILTSHTAVGADGGAPTCSSLGPAWRLMSTRCVAVGVNRPCGCGARDPTVGWAWATPKKGWCKRCWGRRRCLGSPRCARLPAAATTSCGRGAEERKVDWASTTGKTGWCRCAWTRSTLPMHPSPPLPLANPLAPTVSLQAPRAASSPPHRTFLGARGSKPDCPR